MSALLDFLGDYTIQNVLLGAILLGVVSGVLGSFAVLRQQSLLGDTLSHAALPGICLGFLIAGARELPAILGGALVTAMLAALAMLVLTRSSRLKTDAGLGIALSIFFAFGVVLLTYIQGTAGASQGGLDSFLFGQAAAILRSDLYVMAAIAALALALVLALWKEFKLVAFDPGFAATLGLPVLVLETVLTVTIAFAVVIGLQMVGVVLMASMVIAPAVAARQWVRRLETMVVLAALFGVVSGVVGALISAAGRNLATGPLIILAATVLVIVSMLLAPERGILWDALRRRRQERRLEADRVLATVYDLASHHRDRRYAAEESMIDAYHGMATRPALSRLSKRGLVQPSRHMPEEGRHWVLTDAGLDEARRRHPDGQGLGQGASSD
ncbi:MAG: metal ABC transporter permease [Alphaproteobacteria bacterium]|nr:metal ABC transporter permease [Alphaproteobacteria bacterium]